MFSAKPTRQGELNLKLAGYSLSKVSQIGLNLCNFPPVIDRLTRLKQGFLTLCQWRVYASEQST